MALKYTTGFKFSSRNQMALEGWGWGGYIDGENAGTFNAARYAGYNGIYTNYGYEVRYAKPIASTNNIIVGIAVKPNLSQLESGWFLSLYTSTTNVSFAFNNVGAINTFVGGSWSGGTLLGTSVFRATNDQWFYLEFKVKSHASEGYLEVRVNNQTIFTTGVGNLSWGDITGLLLGTDFWATRPTPCSYTDLYIADWSGTTCNDFLGDSRVITVPVLSNGTVNQFTPSSGTNASCVDDVPHDGDTTKVSSTDVGHKDTYVLQAFPFTPDAFHAVTANIYAKKSGDGNTGLKSIITNGTTTRYGPNTSLTSEYAPIQEILEVNPITGLPWSKADLGSLQFGFERLA